MMDLRGIRDLVASLFIMLNKKADILFRLDFLVVLVTVLFLAMFTMDIFRRHFHSTIIMAIFNVFDGFSDSVLVYLMGAMQTAVVKNELFPVWTLVLVMFRYSIGFISAYGVPDSGGRRFMELRSVTNLMAAAFLNKRYGSSFQHPLWLLLALQILRSMYRFNSRDLAFRRIWLGWSSELISEYTRADHDPRNWKPEECVPETMEGYKYLIYGERFKIDKPRYVMHISNDRSSSLITLDKIWECLRDLLRPYNSAVKSGAGNDQGKDMEDLSLAFALSRLLRCRLEDVTLQENIRHINRKLVKLRIIEETDHKRAFRIMELQLAFVNDYFNTRYPMIFWFGLWSLFLSLIHSVATVAAVCWLSVDILLHMVHGSNKVDMIITLSFMLFVVFKEIWEMVAYLLSDWTRLLLVCMHTSMYNACVEMRCMERLLFSFFRSKISTKRWHGLLDQYIFVQSYSDRPKLWNLVHKVTTGMVPKKEDGDTLSSAIDVPEYVWSAALEKIRAILDHVELRSQCFTASTRADNHRYFEDPVNTRDGCCRLPKKLITLLDGSGDRKERYGWACFDLQTSSHVILVWHIATSICEMALAMEHGVDLSNPGFFGSLVSTFTSCFSSKPYLLNVDEQEENHNEETLTDRCYIDRLLNNLTRLLRFTCCSSSQSNGENDASRPKKMGRMLRKRYIIANSLSRYCAYLLVSKPELIPDSFLVPTMVFQETVRIARDEILEGCDSLYMRYNKLKEVAESASQDPNSVKKGDDVLKQGAMLAKQLLDPETNDAERWDILSGVWTELIVHMAPTWNAAAHRKYLESGGEFITSIWALLWHCGIDKSSLWPKYDASEDDAPATPEDNGDGKNNLNREAEPREAGPNDSTT